MCTILHHPLIISVVVQCSSIMLVVVFIKTARKWTKKAPRKRTCVQLQLVSNISQKNWEIFILMIKKRQSEVNTSSTSHREFQRRKDNREWRTKKQKMYETWKQYEQCSLTPTQGPSTVACTIVTSLSQLSHWLHLLLTVGKGQWKH
jgi:alpha-galactosidase/6-phospho-beta-glucosidase family protein